MAINPVQVNSINTTIYTSVSETVITGLSFCNYSAGDETITVYLVPDGSSPTTANIIIQAMTIQAGDTFMLYGGGERFVLDNDDTIIAIASDSGAITAITSYIGV